MCFFFPLVGGGVVLGCLRWEEELKGFFKVDCFLETRVQFSLAHWIHLSSFYQQKNVPGATCCLGSGWR